jgi:hypothetical protein
MFRLCEKCRRKSFPDVRTKLLASEFVMCERSEMAKRKALLDWRASKGLSLEQAAAQFGLSSKGYLSEIERGARCSVAVALKIEQETGGVISAASLNPDVALVDKARAA